MSFKLENILKLKDVRCIADALDIGYKKLSIQEEADFKIYNQERINIVTEIEKIRWVKPFIFSILKEYVSRLVKRVGYEKTRKKLIRELLIRGDLELYHRLAEMDTKKRIDYLILVWL